VIARYSRPEMSRIWSEEGKLARWLEVELAALDAWAEIGSVPPADAVLVRERAKVPTPERVAEIELTTDHDLAAFVDAVAENLGPEGRWVHYGLTSSDVVDTALALQIRDGGALLVEGLDRTLVSVAARAEEHRRTVCIGRSHGIHAEPTTFGSSSTGRGSASLPRSRPAASASCQGRSGRTRRSTRRSSGSPASSFSSSPILSRRR
jgi:adenylosuccinate lyase